MEKTLIGLETWELRLHQGRLKEHLGASSPSTSQMPVLPPERDPTASCSAIHSATQHWPTEHKGPAQRSGAREQE